MTNENTFQLQVHSQQNYEELHLQLHGIIEGCSDLIAALDEDLCIKTCNSAFVREAEQVIGVKIQAGQSLTEALSNYPSHLERLKSNCARARRGEKFVAVEQLTSIHHEIQYYECSFNPVYGLESEIIGSSLIIRNITSQKKWEGEVCRARERAESANRSKSFFLANISHELRTPLGAILGFAEIISDPKVADFEKKSLLGQITKNTQNMLRLIDDLLDLSKVEEGRLEIEQVVFPFMDLISDIQSLHIHKARSKGLELEFHVDSDVPGYVVSDPLRLRQIFTNLLSNAVKFTARGKVRVHVSVQSSVPEVGRMEIAVTFTDSGCGISEKKAPIIFQAYQQADASIARVYGGTGLGLTLSKKLAQSLGGDIQLDWTRPNEGSQFRLTFMTSAVDHPSHQHHLIDHMLGDPTRYRFEIPDRPSIKSLKILLVEDSEDLQTVVRHFLASEGIKVDIAGDGFKALEFAQQNKYDLVLMDINLPGMDGYEATERMKRYVDQTPIVALTAHAMIGQEQKCLSTGFDGYLSKPIKKQMLMQAIREYTRSAN